MTRPILFIFHPTFLLSLLAPVVAALPATAQTAAVKIATIVSRTGPGTTAGIPMLDAVRLAIDEANAAGRAPRVELDEYDDRSSDDGAREAANKIASSGALVVVGPGITTSSLAAGPLFGTAGIAAILPYAHGGGDSSPTTFRPVFSTQEMGEALANDLKYTFGVSRAVRARLK